ncbi:sugar-binding transcriptional regulator [Quadrisphaera oryzae]|uniref:sugar-binding transcriptional regulator n=1 Tax=Quadrisphaera TaxID=317661 RepID=UPI0016458FD2|nr:sugar-binding domain-containing protein [Quadrisphaera sp. RL12-1S]MBC3760622.1 hypothetical protein [Quadrisphaera sp. RL12-1S]
MAVREEDLARRELVASIASMYYLQGLDQNAIAAGVGVSRSSVSRMITEARQTGIVQITVERPLPRDHDLEERLAAAFPGCSALVVADPAQGVPTAAVDRVGALAARYLQDHLPAGGTLAISWGETVAAVAGALPEDPSSQALVVQMIGASGTSRPAIDGPELAQTFARRLGGVHRTLNAPLVVDDAALAQALLRQPPLASVLSAAATADLALIGLGTLEPEGSSLLRAGYVGRDELARCAELGVVGDAAGHMLDAAGAVVPSDLGERMVTLDEASLRGIPRVVAVALGRSKVRIIRASLLSGLVHVLVSDAATVRAVLAQRS